MDPSLYLPLLPLLTLPPALPRPSPTVLLGMPFLSLLLGAVKPTGLLRADLTAVWASCDWLTLPCRFLWLPDPALPGIRTSSPVSLLYP